MAKSIATALAQAGSRSDPRTGATSIPIYQSACFAHPALGESTGYAYSRTANPTRSALEETLATIEGGVQGFAFASGLAAIDTALHLFSPGDRIIVTEDLYGGTFRLFEKVFKPLGLDAIYVDTSNLAAVQQAIGQPGIRGIFIETPTNPLLKIADIRAIASLARSRGIITLVDNTFLTPLFQRPLEMGADLVIYSATKYLAGHNDVVAGAIVTGTPALAERIGFLQNAIGNILGPMDSWLTLRGLKTLPLRLFKQQDNASAIAHWLTRHPHVSAVHYPGLPAHPGHEILYREQAGFGSMISFEVDSPSRIPGILSGVKVFLFAESLGGVESLITYPAAQTHADMDAAIRNRLGISDRLLRLSVGIEDVTDLIHDLEEVL